MTLYTTQQNTPLVLVVDDDAGIRLLLRRVLAREGYAVEQAENGVQALSAYERLRPDVVLLDILMPEMDGFDTCTRLRALPAGDRTPVLMITALEDPESVKRAFEAGATDYITKPIHLDVLCYRVRNMLRGRQAEEALEKERSFISAVLDTAGALVVVLDREGRIVRFNSAAERVTGYPFEEVTGRYVWDLFLVPEEVERVKSVFESLLDGQRSNEYENDWIAKDGRRRLVVWSNTSLLGDDGSVEYVIATGLDITEHNRLEEQVQQQERLAAIGQLAGGIAHDFNNILMSIILSTELLLDESSLPPDLVPDLESIFEDAQEAAHLVEQILDFSHRSYFETRPVDVGAFVRGAVDMLRRTMPESIQILVEVELGQCEVNADPTRLRQVLMNLATNARDAMPQGGELRIGLSRVEVRPGEEPPLAGVGVGEWVCMAVSDTGSGIPPEVMSHLFEPFFTTKPRGEGTGLGLAQVHGIVTQHGGHIGVTTEAGVGTTFRIYLAGCEVEEMEEAPQEKETPVPSQTQRETILLVEDEERVRNLGRRALELLGYRVLTAVNGREALEVYQSAQSVDLVLTDMVMPEMGGRELMRNLRKVDPHLKGVVITGYALEDDLRGLREEGILEVVRKPFDVGTLGEVVRRVLDQD
jgi:two-component system cell cycle sensor histidine kinase/response regulator CckA